MRDIFSNSTVPSFAPAITDDSNLALLNQTGSVDASDVLQTAASDQVKPAYMCAVRSVKDVDYMSGKKAELLVREGAYRAAVDEFHHTKALMSKSGEIDQRTQDEIDNRLAMAQLKWYQTEDDTDHLVEAYRLSVDLLGRCDSRDRELYEGGLSHIVNAMKASGLRFVDYVGPTSVLGYLVKDGCGIKSWHHFANLLYIRHKIGFTDPAIGSNLTAGIARKDGYYLELGKKS